MFGKDLTLKLTMNLVPENCSYLTLYGDAKFSSIFLCMFSSGELEVEVIYCWEISWVMSVYK
jgi:hypothetical protein